MLGAPTRILFLPRQFFCGVLCTRFEQRTSGSKQHVRRVVGFCVCFVGRLSVGCFYSFVFPRLNGLQSVTFEGGDGMLLHVSLNNGTFKGPLHLFLRTGMWTPRSKIRGWSLDAQILDLQILSPQNLDFQNR